MGAIVRCKAIALRALIIVVVLAASISNVRSEIDWKSVSTNPNDRFTYIEDGAYLKDIGVPTYEWCPKDFKEAPSGMVLLVHGLTLHGKRYEVAGRAFASSNYYAVAFDLRGFGRCRTDSQFRELSRIDYRKSYKELVEIAERMRKKYPKASLVVIGESLGATPCLQLAAEHPELVNGVIISGPAVRVNPKMVLSPSSILAGLRGLLIDSKFNINLEFFMRKLVSDDPRIVDEMVNDPLIRKRLSIRDLLSTHFYVDKNLRYGRLIKPQMPVLVLQGSKDNCVIPKDIVKLSNCVRSDDQTLRWFQHFSHLLLETRFVQPQAVDAITNWMEAHDEAHLSEMQGVMKELKLLGAEGL